MADTNSRRGSITTPYFGGRDYSGFPTHDIPNTEKGQIWIRAMVKAIWGNSIADSPNIFYFNRDRYYLIQSYAMGNQPIDFYKTQLGISPEDVDSYANINWKPLSILTTLRNSAINKVNKIGFNIGVIPLDPMAAQEKSKWYAEQKAKIMVREMLEQQQPGLAGQVGSLKPSIKEPEDEEELEIMSSYTYQSERAFRMKKLIAFIFQNNNIENIYREWDKDQTDFGVCVGETDIDSNGNVLIRRVNPECFICSPCLNRDFSDAYYFGEVKQMTIQSLKQMAQDAFTEKQYQDIGKRTTGINYDTALIGRIPNAFNYPYDSKLISVLDISFSTSWYLENPVADDRDNYEIPAKTEDDRANEKYKRKTIQVWMKAKWIVGTDYLFDFGLEDNLLRDEKSLQNSRSKYIVFAPDFYNMQAVSRVERCIPIEDLICLTWYKMQNEMARTIPSGWAIDESALEQTILGGQGGAGTTKKDTIEQFVQTGIFRYRSENLRGQRVDKLPIEALKNGLSNDVIIYYNLLNMHVKTMRMIMGVSDVASGEQGADRTNKQGIEMMYEAGDNVLNDVVLARKYMLERVAKDVLCRAQDVLKVKKIEGYVESAGKNTVEFITADKTLSRELFGIKIEDKPNTDKKIKFEQMLNDAYSKQELDSSDLFIIDDMSDLTQAQRLLGYKQKVYQKRMLQKKVEDRNIEMQLVQTQQQIKAQAEIAVTNAEYEAKTRFETTIRQLDSQIQDKKYQYEMELQKLKSATSIQKEEIITEAKAGVQHLKNQGQVASKVTDAVIGAGTGQPQTTPAASQPGPGNDQTI